MNGLISDIARTGKRMSCLSDFYRYRGRGGSIGGRAGGVRGGESIIKLFNRGYRGQEYRIDAVKLLSLAYAIWGNDPEEREHEPSRWGPQRSQPVSSLALRGRGFWEFGGD